MLAFQQSRAARAGALPDPGEGCASNLMQWGATLARLPNELRDLLADLADRGVVVPFQAGTVLTHQGSAAPEVTVLLQGEARACLRHADGRAEEVLGWHLLPGDLLTPGTALLEPELFSVTAEKDGYCLAIPVDRLPQTAPFYQQLARQYRLCATLVAQQATGESGRPLIARLAGHLLDKADGAGTVVLRRKGELAVQLAVTRETLSRTLAKLRQLGLCTIHRERVHIISQAGLEALSKKPRGKSRR